MLNVDKLRGEMVSHGYNQRRLAAELDISENALSLKIRGKTAFTLDEVEKICALLKIEKPESKCEIFLP